MPAVIERNADPREALSRVGRSIDAYRADVQYLADNKADLTEKYPNEWVAVLEGRVIAHSRQNRELLKQLRNSGLLQKSPVIYYLTTKPSTLIL